MERDAFTEPQARRAARRAIVERVVTGRMNGDETPGVKELMRDLRDGRVWIAGQALAGHADRHGTAIRLCARTATLDRVRNVSRRIALSRFLLAV